MNDIGSGKSSMLDINCLSAGNTLVLKIDSVNVIRSQFDKFLEKLISKEKIFHDAKLPLFIVDSFSKLFKYWVELPELKKLVSRDMLEEVFNEMAKIFDSERCENSSSCQSNDLSNGKSNSPLISELSNQPNGELNGQPNDKLKAQSNSNLDSHTNVPFDRSCLRTVCLEFNRNIQMVNNDPKFSIDMHRQSEDHLRNSDSRKSTSYLNKANSVASSTPNIVDSVKRNGVAPLLSLMGNSNFGRRGMVSGFKSSSCWNLSSSVKAKNYKPSLVIDPSCRPCSKNVGDAKEIGNHQSSPGFRKQGRIYEKSQELLETYRTCITITDDRNFEFICRVCDKKQTGTNCFVQHCESKNHKKMAVRFETNTPSKC